MAQHRSNWGVRAAVAPDGRTVAYTVLPPGAQEPDTEGELWLLPLDGRAPRRLATGVDLRSALVWTPDSQQVSYALVKVNVIEERRVDVRGAGDQIMARSTLDSRWFLMGYDADGKAALYAHETGGGTEIARSVPGELPGSGVQIGGGPARGFAVAADGRTALLLLMSEDGRRVYRAVVQGESGAALRLTAGGREDTGIAWNPRTGEATVGVIPDTSGTAVTGAAGVGILVPPSGFDVPVSWSPDGSYLVVRHFSGITTDQPGFETIVMVGPKTRIGLTGFGQLSVLGWSAPRD